MRMWWIIGRACNSELIACGDDDFDFWPYYGRSHRAGRKSLKWNSFSYKEALYDVSHLHPQIYKFMRPAGKENPAEEFDVEVRFTSHCFTRSPRREEIYDLKLIYPDKYELRLFDVRRWEMSKQLANIIRSLPDKKPRHNKSRGNYFSIEMVTESGAKVEYDIFFKVWKPGKGRLEMLIETAFIRDPEYASNTPTGKPVRFWIILHNTRHGLMIHT
jgi:hypothetical protein